MCAERYRQATESATMLLAMLVYFTAHPESSPSPGVRVERSAQISSTRLIVLHRGTFSSIKISHTARGSLEFRSIGSRGSTTSQRRQLPGAANNDTVGRTTSSLSKQLPPMLVLASTVYTVRDDDCFSFESAFSVHHTLGPSFWKRETNKR